jgi:uncharacterized protein (TIGR02117 family)
MVAGAMIPENPRSRPPAAGVTIHLDSSLVHSWLILPVAAAGHDWRQRLPPFPDGRAAGPYLGLSWGERDFFLATPTWADLDLRLAFRALVAGHQSLVHLYRLEAPAGRPIHLSEAQYRRLVAHLESALAPGSPLPGYGTDDLFLPARGRYSPWQTCNQWTRDALAAAGVRVGRWTPLPQGLMWRFPRAAGETG